MVTAKKAVAPTKKKPVAVIAPPVAERPVAATRSPQDSPIIFRGADQRIHVALKVDSAAFVGARMQIDGWLVGPGILGLECAGRPAEFKISRSSRPDVAVATKLPESNHGYGFTIAAASGADPILKLELELDGQSHILSFPLRVERPRVFGHGGKAGVLAMLDAACASTLTEEGVVLGWAVCEPGATLWLETSDGSKFYLDDALRLDRKDVLELHGPAFAENARHSGFLIRVAGATPGSVLRLIGQKDAGPIVVSEIAFDTLPAEPAAASRWLFGMATPSSQLAQRFESLDAPILEALITHTQRNWPGLPVDVRQIGLKHASPLASVIVPLYGRTDFVEHQIMEFSRDPDFLRQAELIYVVDDPALVESFIGRGESLYKLYGVPFRWIWGNANRGFSGANNLGAAHATGANLVFLNSDAIPQQPGWLKPMLDTLDKNPRIGAVGPRLTFADGSIQHAGMVFVRREDLGVWINEHPQMGLAPSLDKHLTTTTVPAVTGACLVMRRKDFDKVGGWDTGYLIGDFEDSDLCLKLRTAGLDIAYMPTVQLTHLERQSFKMVGGDDYRLRVVIYNALRHQRRWGPILAAPFKHLAL